jgi:hypothetical protein
LDLGELTRGLTGASDLSDWCVYFVGFASGELIDSVVFGSYWRWSVLGWFGGVLLSFVKGSSFCWLCFGGVSVPGPREVIEALGNICCAVVVATGLTGSVHWSD